MPEDSQAFLTEYKGKQLDAIVEQVRDGTTLRVRLLLDGEHQMANIALAGVRSPRTAAKAGESSEPFAEEVRRRNPFDEKCSSSWISCSTGEILRRVQIIAALCPCPDIVIAECCCHASAR